MANRRTISWSTAMRDLRNDRVQKAGIREERLRPAGQDAPALSAWRGQSGRRYVVRILPVAGSNVMDVTDSVVIAVRRGADEAAHMLDIATVGSRPSSALRTRWIASVQARGATEIHVHRLAASEAERHAIIDDLKPGIAKAP